MKSGGLDKFGRWIEASRPPAQGISVLAVPEGWPAVMAYRLGAGWFAAGRRPLRKITHWMPLPDLPEPPLTTKSEWPPEMVSAIRAEGLFPWLKNPENQIALKSRMPFIVPEILAAFGLPDDEKWRFWFACAIADLMENLELPLPLGKLPLEKGNAS